MPRDPNYFPHANKITHPVNRFFINGRWLNLYTVDGHTPSTRFSLYWQNENNPVQHAMNALEILNILSSYLKPFARYIDFDEKFVGKNGWVCSINDCEKPSCTLGLSSEELQKINGAGHILVRGTLAIGTETASYIRANRLGKVVCIECRRKLGL